ncbi:Protein CSN12 -like protein [Escovopsis weberi]|uniref:Protein CSN12 homolog n=1 Tax=Escovopsis weberi TaxID=150374 RepID=A0A0M9VXK9_ESCWE|nr:Protein CSN12 -like protein [Escovopsis weberi]
MNDLFKDFANAHAEQNGYLLAQTLSPVSPADQPHRLRAVLQSTNSHSVKGDIKHFIKTATSHKRSLDHDEVKGWVEVYASYWAAVGEIVAGESGKSTWTKVYDAWKELTSMLIRGYNNFGFEAWTIPCLYVVGKYLRLFAIKSDIERKRTAGDAPTGNALIQDDFDPEMETQSQLRDCEQHLKRIFTLCLNDRVTFKFYEGVLFFLEENYVEAEKHLVEAQGLCHKDAKQNMERILTYLIPCRLLTSHVLPTKALLEPYPRLQKLFLPLAQCIKKGDLRAFDIALQGGEEEFVKRRIYLTLERGRDIALRNLLRKVFIAGGYDDPKEGESEKVRRTRVPVVEFRAAICMGSGGELVDTDEVECLLANMIYKDLMKGYIARDRGIVVLSKKGAFPGTGV